MHIPDDHERMLPEEIRPMIMPDTRQEAHLLLLCLECGFYSTIELEDAEEEVDVSTCVEEAASDYGRIGAVM